MKTAKPILTIILSGYLIFAMGGLSIFHHLCNCSTEENNNTSFFLEQSCCSSNIPEPIVYHNDTNQNICGVDDCESCNCTTLFELLALNDTVKVDSSRLSTPVQFLFTTYDVDQEINYSSITSKSIIYNKHLPIPRSGRAIVILYQRLKIPFRA
ncbi:MAG: hypothetical protein PHI03_01065 [Bacteroidales bacterium]|nr:hypothetical protein [Bacteroidales bacterium]MDD4671500.1 hypothetical protein [Bacteroidales bacterium]MDY0349322.1 hypothetical protein [Tenuifilaceae bacterium]